MTMKQDDLTKYKQRNTEMQVRIGNTLYKTVESDDNACEGCCVSIPKDGNRQAVPSFTKTCKTLNESRKPDFCNGIVWRIADDNKSKDNL